MFSFPVIYLLYIFYAFAALCALLSVVTFIHLIHFGVREFKTYFVVVTYFVGVILILGLFLNSTSKIDWEQNITLGQSLSFFNSVEQ